jgi:16S rRNA (guanine527-N7)-methyltransferase
VSSLESRDREALLAGLAGLGITPGEEQVERWLRHVQLVRQWGRTYNLVSPGAMDDLIRRHVLDALAIHPWAAGAGPLLDVGTGAGFPGLPLAILDASRPVVLIDSVGKKIRFLNHAIRELELERVEALHGRVESFSPATEFSTITSRAFSSLADFAASVRHLAGPDTRLLAMKGKFPEEELAALPAWVQVQAVEPVSVPGLEAERHLAILVAAPAERQE